VKIKALPTAYRGVTYRSRTEARWAVFFTENDIPFNYEFEGFDLGGAWYLPDFWLPAAKSWFEVKPDEPTETEIKKAQLLAKGTGRLVFVAPGNPQADIGIYVYSPTGRMQTDWKFAYAHEEGVGFLTSCTSTGEFKVRLNGTINEMGYYGCGPDAELNAAGNHQFRSDRDRDEGYAVRPQSGRVIAVPAGRRILRKT
jgi:hypothetical protein